MPQIEYELTSLEQEELKQIQDRLARDGGLYACDETGELLLDATNRPAPREYVILRGRRYLVDATGRVWRYFAEGSRKDPAATDGGGAPWRNNRVEMWNGRWRRVVLPSGKPAYEKVLISRPLDKRINGQPGTPQIVWYCKSKGYHHPHDEPHESTAGQREALDKGQDGSGGTARHAARQTNR